MGIRLHLTKQLRLHWCFGNRTVLVHDTGYVEVLVAFPTCRCHRKRSQVEPTKEQGIGISVQEEPSICFAAYFAWRASSHRMAARSNSVTEVTPNFSFARPLATVPEWRLFRRSSSSAPA